MKILSFINLIPTHKMEHQMKYLISLLFIFLFPTFLSAQNSGSWIPVTPIQGDTITIICDPQLDSQTANISISSMNLYWGINGVPGNWTQPDAKYWPSGTSTDGSHAVQSPMTKIGTKWQIKIKTDDQISNLVFLFRANNNQFWLRDNGQDYNLKIRSTPQSYVSHAESGNSIRVQAQTYFVTFSNVKDNMFKIAYDDSVETKTDMLIDGLTTLPFSSVTETDSTLEMTNPISKVILRKSTMTYFFTDLSGVLLLDQSNGDGFGKTQNARSISFKIKNEALYGMGEKGIDLNRRGFSFDTYNRANYGYNNALSTMKINIPLLTTTGNYALFFDNVFPADVDLKDQIRYSARGGFMSFYFIPGDLKNQLKGYHELTGYQPLPPKWAFGFIQSKYGYKTETEVKSIANSFRSKGIPADAIILDLYWFGVENNMGNLNWNASGFPNPTKFVSDMNILGFKIIPIQELYLTTGSRLYSPFSTQDLLGKTAAGSSYNIGNFWAGSAGLVDITNPAAQSLWWSESKKIMDTGISGWWTDLGEPENHPNDMVHFGGSTDKVHNTHNLLWAKTLFDGFNADFPNQRFFNLTRSGTGGMQRYATFPWSGDVERSFNGLSLQPQIMLGMSLSGIGYESSDLGGFAGPATTPELYTRWLQFGAFNGIMRAHTSQNNPEPWQFGTQTQSIVTDYIKLRYSLFPYLYTLASKYTFDGEPIVRPLIYNFPDDDNVKNMSDEFMLGDDILIAPILKEGQSSRDVYLPGYEGWAKINSPSDIQYSNNITINTPLNEIPVLVNKVAIIPSIPFTPSLQKSKLDTLILTCYGFYGYGELYEDDGESQSYRTGSFLKSEFEVKSFIFTKPKHLNKVMATTFFSYKYVDGNGYSNSPENRTYIISINGINIDYSFVENDTASLPYFHDSIANWKMSTADAYVFDADNSRYLIRITKKLGEDFILDCQLFGSDDVNDKPNPFTFSLSQNYPNPFNPVTTISFTTAKSGFNEVSVFNLLGQKITTLVSSTLQPGKHQFQFDGSTFPSGIYFVRLSSDEGVKTIKMTLMK